MKKHKGLNYDYLNKFQERLDEEANNVAFQLKEKLESFGDIIRKETGFTPIPNKFVNWYIDNHYKPKKRRLPFKLTDELIIKYCIEYKEEIERRSRKFSQKKDFNEELENQITKILKFAFKNDEKISIENLEELLQDLLFILSAHKLPKEIKKLGTNEVDLNKDCIRYCINQVYELDKNTKTRNLLITYLHLKFKVFDNLDFNPDNISVSSLNKKFKTKPLNYPK